jgi:hypothetical protein
MPSTTSARVIRHLAMTPPVGDLQEGNVQEGNVQAGTLPHTPPPDAASPEGTQS